MERQKRFKQKFNERLFLAIKLPLEIRREINSILSNFSKESRNFAIVDQEQLHLTLKFLGGNISQQSQQIIIENLRPIFASTPKIKIVVDSLMFGFPKQVIPKVLYFNVNKNDELTELASIINYRVKKLDLDDVAFFIEGKKLIFHLTVGRIKHSSNRHYKIKIIDLIKSINFNAFEFEADTVYLIKSDMKGLHPKYTDIQSFKLKS